MNQNQNTVPSNAVMPPAKSKNKATRRRMFVSGLLLSGMTFFATSAGLLLLAFLLGPQLSNALWKTDETQQALYGTSAAVHNEKLIIDITTTAFVIQAGDQQKLYETIIQREALLDEREADLNATADAIAASINLTKTAEVILNEQQRTQVAINFSETQLAINQQSIRIAIEATATQQALEARPTATAIQPSPEPTLSDAEEDRPFIIRGDILFGEHPTAKCDWQGIAGTVSNLEGNLTGINVLQIRVLGVNLDETIMVGDNLGLGEPYTWGVKVAEDVNNESYLLRLESLDGAPLSPMIRVKFNESCENNLAVINLMQVQPLDE